MSRGWRVAARTAQGVPARLEAFDAPPPEPTGDEIIVSPRAAWIDVAAPSGAADSAHGTAGASAIGMVVKAGPSAQDLLGKDVVVPAVMACGECDTCRRGAAAVCPSGKRLGRDTHGTATTACLAHGRWVVALAGGLSLSDGAGALAGGPALDAYGLYARTGVAPKDPTVVVGDDVTARLLIEVLISKGAPPVVITADPAYAEWIVGTGGRPVSATYSQAELTEAVAAMSPGARPRRVFCTTATAAARQRALDATTPGGTLTLLGGAATPEVDLSALAATEVTIIGVAAGHPDLLSEVCALAVRGELSLEAAVHWLECADAIELSADPSHAPRGWVLRLQG